MDPNNASDSNNQPGAPDQQLPPVEPPSPGFLVQLFFIPLVIVTIIVLVWLMFSWIAHLGTKPEKLVADLERERLTKGSWQKALTLANMLRDPRYEQLRNDRELALRLASLLERQLESGGVEGEDPTLRLWLCRALGQFEIDAGMPALIKAATQEKGPDDLQVRRAALQAIAMLADRLDRDKLMWHEDLLPALQQGATDRSDDPSQEEQRGQLRSTAAYALGIVGGSRALDELASMLSDPFPNARYNAATGLARHGDERSVVRLQEMLDRNNQAALQYEDEDNETHQWKRIHVITNGLRAVRQLLGANPNVQSESLRSAVQQLKDTAELEAVLAVEVNETLQMFSAAET